MGKNVNNANSDFTRFTLFKGTYVLPANKTANIANLFSIAWIAPKGSIKIRTKMHVWNVSIHVNLAKAKLNVYHVQISITLIRNHVNHAKKDV
jgi:hypothetical protein